VNGDSGSLVCGWVYAFPVKERTDNNKDLTMQFVKSVCSFSETKRIGKRETGTRETRKKVVGQCRTFKPSAIKQSALVCLFALSAAGCSTDLSDFAGAAGGATSELVCAVAQILVNCDA
jgi:hypothetical protein